MRYISLILLNVSATWMKLRRQIEKNLATLEVESSTSQNFMARPSSLNSLVFKWFYWFFIKSSFYRAVFFSRHRMVMNQSALHSSDPMQCFSNLNEVAETNRKNFDDTWSWVVDLIEFYGKTKLFELTCFQVILLIFHEVDFSSVAKIFSICVSNFKQVVETLPKIRGM